jgi:hypothetical protein
MTPFVLLPTKIQDIENYQYLMEDMTVLPAITFLHLMVMANGHAFEASAFHVLRLCTGIRTLVLQLVAIGSKVNLFSVYLILSTETGKKKVVFWSLHLYFFWQMYGLFDILMIALYSVDLTVGYYLGCKSLLSF